MNHLLFLAALLGLGRCSHGNRHMRLLSIDNSIEHNGLPTSAPLKVFRLSARPEPLVAHKPGTMVELVCEAYGSPAPSIHWYKNDNPVYEHDSESSSLASNNPESLARVVSALLVSHTATRDRYTCVVRSGGRITTATSTVYRSNGDGGTEIPERTRLNPLAPRILVTYKAYVDHIGNDVILPCRVRGHPRPHIQWTHKGTGDQVESVIRNGPRMKILRSGELVLSPLRWSDLGEFTCHATNIFGSRNATTFVYPAKAG